jgi:hypothetical protein
MEADQSSVSSASQYSPARADAITSDVALQKDSVSHSEASAAIESRNPIKRYLVRHRAAIVDLTGVFAALGFLIGPFIPDSVAAAYSIVASLLVVAFFVGRRA